jgi:hypothetical protein
MPMDAKERAVWEDAEGSLSIPGKGLNKSPRLRTTQMEREILLDYCAGAEKDGVRCRVYTSVVRKTAKTPRALTFYYTAITGVANIGLELQLTAPYRRSAKLAKQIRRFKAFLGLKRKRIQRSVAKARELSLHF